MKYLLTVLFGLMFIWSSDGSDQITTVFKFNTVRAEDEDVKFVKYLNTCTAAYVEYPGVLLFNITPDTPLPESTIPPLYDGLKATKWQQMMDNGTIEPITSRSTLSDRTTRYLDLFFQENPLNTNLIMEKNNYKVLKETTADFRSETIIFNEADIDQNSVNSSFLLIKFQVRSRLKIQLNYQDKQYIEIRLQSDATVVCYGHDPMLQSVCYSGRGYTGDEQGNFKILISLVGEILIHDYVAGTIHKTKKVAPGKLRSITQKVGFSFNVYDHNVQYQIIQAYPSTIISPKLDLNTNISLIILYVRKPGFKINVYVEEDNTGNTLQLDYREIVGKYRHNKNMERVLTKVNVIFPDTWKNQKRILVQSEQKFVTFISNIWEERYLELYKIKEVTSCLISKLNIIYDTNTMTSNTNENSIECLNGGVEMDSMCLCTPGFAGKKCEIPCDRNNFGHKCSMLCSKSPNQCKGMVLCTSNFGCSCATGYQGEQCLEHCPEDYYGADCKQKCGECIDGCDQYTGVCRGGCTTPYLIRPYCKQPHSYLEESPRVLDSSYNAVNLQIDLTTSNIERSYDHTKFYKVQYREDKDITWNDGPYEAFNVATSNISVEGLKPGCIYYFRVLLVDVTLETHDPDWTKSCKAETKCITSENDKHLTVISVTNTSISLTWDKDTDLGEKDCPSRSYSLNIENTEKGYVESQKIVDIKGNSYQIEDLSPGQTYHIELKKNTIYGESKPVSSVNVTTDDTIDYSVQIPGVTINQTESHVNIEWFKSSLYKTYYIKYKLVRHLSGKKDSIDAPLQVITTSNTSYTLPNLEPNSQYQLFVTADKNQNVKTHNITFITSK
ncbi:uncharacterized protein LOC103515118 isoform X1 [Diaphorina citri]|uniref:Uncharacterized protein LOC103515118 isoform X1 n=1 Tax=Diaphorina citri TaxID=121845 RepID=A0A1S3DBC4_DIACI|nr:uncharacterized protein LOC103515118 isoform X1 [Diaphorina citri]